MKRQVLLAVTWLAAAPVAAQQPADVRGGVASRARIDPSQDVAFQALILPETVYVGQQATYQVGVFLSEEVRARLRRNPQFVPPEVRSALAFDLPSVVDGPARVVGVRHYDVHVFQRAIFPLAAGRLVVPPAHLDYALPLSNSFFAREESHSERTAPLTLVARDPPAAGRPADFHGAVGRLVISAHTVARQARVGDPLMFTVTVDGIGNVTLLPRPDLQVGWADVVSGGDRVQLDSASVLMRGRKDFDWILTPRRAGRLALPAIRYPYFNPYTERYEIALTRPDSLTVAGGSVLESEAPAPAVPRALPIRRLYSGVEPPPLSSHTAYWLLIALSPLPALALTVTRRPYRRRPPSPVRVLRQLATAPEGRDPARLRRAYAAAIADRVHATAAAMSDHAQLVRTLRRAGVSAPVAEDADRLLTELDAVVFGRAGVADPGAAHRAYAIVSAIDAEALPRQALAVTRVGAGLATFLLLCVVVGAASVWAAGRDTVAESVFYNGVQAYDHQQFDTARSAFFELAQARPRSADAWINFGTSAWALHDTAAAVIGWQRAARLQPMASDARQLLRLTPGFRDGLLGDIPPVSLDLLAVAGALLWLGGWSALTLHARRALPRLRTPAFAALVVAAGIAVAGRLQRDILAGRDAAVVVHAGRLRGTPSLGAEEGAETLTGETGRIVMRQGVWVRVRLSDRREGWLESRWLEPLDHVE